MGPIILLDKSTIQGLSFKEVEYLHRYYSPLITPILMRELVSSLAKNKKSEELEKKLSILSAKLNGSQSFYCSDATGVAISSLIFNDIPLTGQVPMSGGKRVRSIDGSIGVMFDEPLERRILREWEKGNFTVDDKTKAELIRSNDQGIDLKELKDSFSLANSLLPKFDNSQSIVTWIEKVHLQSERQDIIIQHLIEMLKVPQSEINSIFSRWEKEGRPKLEKFCAYACYYYKVIFYFQIGLAQGIISTSKKAKTHLDTQYLLYLPFSFCFSSADNYLINSADLFLRANQFNIDKNTLKSDLNKFISHLETTDKNSLDQTVHVGLGNYPPDGIGETLTHQIWDNTMSPRPKDGLKNEVVRSKEDDQRILKMLKSMTTNSVHADSNKSIDPTVLEKYKDKDLDQRTALVIEKLVSIFKIDSEDALEKLKKNISPKQVAEFYEFYGEVWRPDNGYNSFLPNVEECTRGLYLGDIAPEIFLNFINRNIFLFDEILIVDPILNPWSMRHEYNPINKPEDYLEDTLKIVIFYVMAMPYIESGIVKIIHDPFDMDFKAKKEIYEYLEKTYKNQEFSDKSKAEMDFFQRKQLFRIAQRVAQFDDSEKLKSFLKMKDGDVEGVKKFLKMKSERDYISLEAPLMENKGSMTLLRNGPNIEEALYISQITRSILTTNMWVNRSKIFNLAKGNKKFRGGMANNLNGLKIPILNGVSPFLICDLHQKGFLEGIRKFLYYIMLAYQDKTGEIRGVLEKKYTKTIKMIELEIKEFVDFIEKEKLEIEVTYTEVEVLLSSLGLKTKFSQKLISNKFNMRKVSPSLPISIYTPVNFSEVE